MPPASLGLAAFVGAGPVFAGVADACSLGMRLARMPWNRVGGAARCAGWSVTSGRARASPGGGVPETAAGYPQDEGAPDPLDSSRPRAPRPGPRRA
ncbi:MAG TPA: hypothetical protein VKP69_06860 [Isosphaeraceae bacterium]|nr:hypothetical protein [Isosphaeraceae bacterium]